MIFSKIVEQNTGYKVTKEHMFHHVRKWRFDYAIVDKMVAVEVEGGVHSGGRHTRGVGFINDMEKYNEATVLGWRLIRVTPQQLLTQKTLKYIEILCK